MRCLVTGGTGHIGSHLTRWLLKQGVDTTLLVRPNSSYVRIHDLLPQVHIVQGDLTNISLIDTQLKRVEPELVFHLGWYGVSRVQQDSFEQLTSNLYGSIELLRLAHETGCRHWIALGSQAEYGVPNSILTEDFPTRPVTLYGATKLSACILSNELCKTWNMDFSWLRLTATFGPGDDVSHLIPSAILTLIKGEKPALTLGEQKWDYLFVEDAVNALWKVAITPKAKGIFNLGSGEAYSIKSIVERVRNLIDPKLPLGFGELPYRADQIMHLQADITKLKTVTGWKPRTSLDDGLKQTVEWYKKNGDFRAAQSPRAEITSAS